MEAIKGNPRVTYRIATAEDVEAVTGRKPAYSLHALAFFLDGAPVGLGGWKIDNGNMVAFSDIKEGTELPKQTIYRCGLKIMDFIKSKGVSMYAQADNPELCERLGFIQIKDGVYKWLSSQHP